MMIFHKKRGSHDITNPEDVDLYSSSNLNNYSALNRCRSATMESAANDSGIVNIAMEMDEDAAQLHHRHPHHPYNHQQSQHQVHNVNLLNPAILNNHHVNMIRSKGSSGGITVAAVAAGGSELCSLRSESGSGSGAAAASALQLIWEDVSFKVKLKSWSWPEASLFPSRKVQDKQILQCQSGQVTTGQLIGIIGPSGAGKSTLLNCLTGRYRESHGLTGSVYVTTTSTAATPPLTLPSLPESPVDTPSHGSRSILSDATTTSCSFVTSCTASLSTLPADLVPGSNPVIPGAGAAGVAVSGDWLPSRIRKKLINIAFIPQRDNLFMNFTVKETLVFASKMKNTGSNSSYSNNSTDNEVIKYSEGSAEQVSSFVDHEKEAIKVMKYLNLESCSKTRISRCSGGQVKRVCIGVELISRPEILVLDEPTTGLDSSTAFQCVSILKTLVECKVNPPAILATIHQPSAKILMKFNLIYLLSKNGQCLYFGPPDQIKSYFVTAGLEYPLDYNPADFAIETAYGDYGEQVFDKLSSLTRKSTSGLLVLKNSKHKNNNNETENMIMTCTKGYRESERIKITTIVKSMESRPYSFLSHVYLLLIRNWMKIYRDSGQLYLRVFQNIVIGLMVSFLWNPDIGHEDGCWSDFLDSGTKSANATDAKIQYLNKITRINSNSALIFAFLIYVIMVSVMSTVLTFPSETLVIVKEMKNNWYSCASYYWSKMIAEIPILCFMIFILSIIIYPLTGQIPILWRFLILYVVTCMMGEVCQSIGMLFGTIFSDDLISACFSSVASGFPPILFGGFVVQFQHIRWYLKPFAYLSYLKYAFESAVIAIYGFDRCTRKIANNAAENIAKARNPVELIGTLVSSFNLTAKDAQTFSLLLNVDTACVEGVINGTIDYFGINRETAGNTDSDYTDDGDYADDMTTTVKPFTLAPTSSQLERMSRKEEASYVLSYFGLKDDELLSNIFALLTFMLVLKIATYAVLRQKSRI